MKFVVIAVPGRIAEGSDGHEILESLGGKRGISSALKNQESKRLILKFGFDSSSSFVSADSNDDCLPCTLVAKAQLWRSGRCTVSVLGSVVKYFSFNHPADFMHMSISPIVAGHLADGRLPHGEMPPVKPPIFTKIDTIDHLFNKSTISALVSNRVKRDQNNSVFNAVARFDDVEMPSTPLSTVTIPTANSILMNHLEKLFDRRPLWLRSSIDEFLPPGFTNWKRRTAFARICYIFSDGPWRSSMCRLGYDPRKDPESRIYQTIDFRDPEYRTISWRTGKRLSMEPLSIDIAKDSEKTYGEYTKDVLKPNPEVHFLVPPNRPSQIYQLCDICDAGIQNVIRDASGMLNAECSKSTGWYTPATLSKIRDMMIVKSLRMRQQYNLKY